MKLLLDTHTLLWTLSNDNKIESVKDIINNLANEIYVSTASLWEIEIKHNLRPDSMPFSAKEIVNIINNFTDFIILPVDQNSICFLDTIIQQGIHKDPFDHLLLATAFSNQLKLLTHDEKISQYEGIDLLKY